ncbi:type II toxin-antitoxin system prevent-host-death family antitoxin [Umezawaea sp. Da 62-37]|uniref:type II toxin-antitoxin system Phd/YefM family antitoxin n=1 Tax=Umezawaea sp. Da 62-37 TaxID=3075927 RepID=UPI0028F72CFE|nr:type II toxin-antitoxin system prevent-host-death family antitoxin [Umezawaea sp. Da 62-37]WNV92037.1 type II toxin-antitoxin system prevent-host-death family antitoxin [Umezawaea sp. Da 62-37]
MEIARITAHDLVNNTAEVLARVEAGEAIEVTRDGVPVALLTQSPATAMTEGLIRAGLLESDWRERQRLTLRRLRGKVRPSAPGGALASETIIEMREERF